MAAPTRPTNLVIPFSLDGSKNAIPVNTTGDGKAAYESGFPSYTLDDSGSPTVSTIPITAGGKDFNGVLYDITTHTLWVNAGGQYLFDATLSAAIGGYPAGMVLQSNDGLSSYVSAINSNTTDFNSTPAAIGVSWLPWAGGAQGAHTVDTTGGTTTMTAAEAVNGFIAVTGTLTSDAIITVPARLGEWTVLNGTTGDFTLTVKTPSGTGVTISQGGASGIIGNGTNIEYAVLDVVTQSPGDSSSKAASTEFVDNALTSVVAGISGFIEISGDLTITDATPSTIVVVPTAGTIPVLTIDIATNVSRTFTIQTTQFGATPYTGMAILRDSGGSILGLLSPLTTTQTGITTARIYHDGVKWRADIGGRTIPYPPGATTRYGSVTVAAAGNQNFAAYSPTFGNAVNGCGTISYSPDGSHILLTGSSTLTTLDIGNSSGGLPTISNPVVNTGSGYSACIAACWLTNTRGIRTGHGGGTSEQQASLLSLSGYPSVIGSGPIPGTTHTSPSYFAAVGKVDDTKALVLYQRQRLPDVYSARVATDDGSAIGWPGAVLDLSISGSSATCKMVALDTTGSRFLLAWNSSGSLSVVVLTVSGNDVTAGTVLSIGSVFGSGAQSFGLCQYNTNEALLSYGNTSGNLCVSGLTISGTTVTASSALQLTSSTTGSIFNFCCNLDARRAVVAGPIAAVGYGITNFNASGGAGKMYIIESPASSPVIVSTVPLPSDLSPTGISVPTEFAPVPGMTHFAPGGTNGIFQAYFGV